MERKHSPFTLVELLVVMAIVALLASLLLGAIAKARAAAKGAVCKGNVGQLLKGVAMWYPEHNMMVTCNTGTDNTTQVTKSWVRYLHNPHDPQKSYISDGGVFGCPRMTISQTDSTVASDPDNMNPFVLEPAYGLRYRIDSSTHCWGTWLPFTTWDPSKTAFFWESGYIDISQSYDKPSQWKEKDGTWSGNNIGRGNERGYVRLTQSQSGETAWATDPWRPFGRHDGYLNLGFLDGHVRDYHIDTWAGQFEP